MSSEITLSSPSSPFQIIFFLDATKNHKEQELKFIIDNAKLLPNVHGDTAIIVVGVLHKIQHPMGYQMRASLVSSSGTNIRVIKDEVLRKADVYVKTLAKNIEEKEESKEVDIIVKVSAGIPSKMVVLQESTNYNAAWVILDRFLKKDFQFYLKHLPSNIAIVRDDLSFDLLRQTSTTTNTNRIDHNVEQVTVFSVSKPVPSKIDNIEILQSDVSSAFEIHIVENASPAASVPVSPKNGFSEDPGLLIAEEDNNHTSEQSEICNAVESSEIVEVITNDMVFVPTNCLSGQICDELNSSEDNENHEFHECIRSPVASSSSDSRNSEVEKIVVSEPVNVSKEYKDSDKNDLCCVKLKEDKSDIETLEAETMLESITKDSKDLELEAPRLASSLLTFNQANGGVLYRDQFMSLTETEKPSLLCFSHDNSRSLCGICYEEKNYWQISINETCAHTFCYDCMSKYIVTKIEGNVTTIACPGINCKNFLDINSFRKIIPNDVLLKWDELLCMSLIPESQMVYCPFQDCSALFIKDSDEVVKDIKCPNCKRLFCGQCLVPWHPEFTCEEFKKLYSKKKGKENLLVKELAKKKQWRQCPNCKFYVERTYGCLHITCRCGYGFCYRCGGRWNGGCNCRKTPRQ